MPAQALLQTVALFVGAYLLGSAPFGLLVARAWAPAGGDIGGANTWRGRGPSLVAAALDMLKGALPALASLYGLGLPPAATAAVGMAAILGHSFSLYLGFKGSKSAMAYAGVLLAVAPPLFLVGCVIWLAGFLLTRRATVGAIGAAVAAGALGAAQYLAGQLALPYALLVLAAMALMISLRRSSIRRPRAGAEGRSQKRL